MHIKHYIYWIWKLNARYSKTTINIKMKLNYKEKLVFYYYLIKKCKYLILSSIAYQYSYNDTCCLLDHHAFHISFLPTLDKGKKRENLRSITLAKNLTLIWSSTYPFSRLMNCFGYTCCRISVSPLSNWQ